MSNAEHDPDPLTEEERAAIEDGDEDERQRLAAVVGDDDDDAPETARHQEREQEAPPAVPYRSAPPADLADREQRLRDRKAAALRMWESGEISAAAYHGELDAVTGGMLELERVRTKAEISQEMAQQTYRSAVDRANHRWNDAQATFFDAQARAGVDYRNNPTAFGQLDRFIRVLAADEGNNDKPMSWFLQEAHRSVQALRGAGGKAGGEDRVRAHREREQRDTHVEVGRGRDDGDGFGDVDSLDGFEFEDAVARMSASERARFVRG